MTEKTEQAPAPAARPEPVDQLVTTEHSITIAGRTLAYQVTTGTIVLREEAEKKGEQEGQHEGHQPRASVFFTAYTLKDAGEAGAAR
jgi:carboxypeptidase C (cathepsin A)